MCIRDSFGAIMGIVSVKLYWILANASAVRDSWVSYGTIGSFVAVAVSLIFINGYTSVIFWIFIGLCLVAVDAKRLEYKARY